MSHARLSPFGLVLLQEIRRDATAILALLTSCDLFLNQKNAEQMNAACAKMWEYLVTLGMTRADLMKLSPKLVAQINEVDKSEKEARKKRLSTEGGEAGEAPQKKQRKPKEAKEKKEKDPKAKKEKSEKSSKRAKVEAPEPEDIE